MLVKIIDKIDVSEPIKENNFGAYKLISVIPQGLNQRNFLRVCFVFAMQWLIIKIIIKKCKQQRMVKSCLNLVSVDFGNVRLS